MRIRYLFPLMVFCLNTAWADFSNTQMWWHPLYLTANEPYLIDLKGEWPTDCHPGEQKPVISEYTGDTVLIEFEIIVEHFTCNDVVTPYRVLVDMSDVIDSVNKDYDFIDVTVRYDGAELNERLGTLCVLCGDPPPPPRNINPEAGLYNNNGLEKQGLLLARQNQRMAVYPLIYDEAGSSEWLYGAGGIVEDVFFVDLYELTGGQCLGCPPPDEPPELGVVGKVSLLMDSQGLVQMKVNDGLFITFDQSEFGYGSRDVGGHPQRSVPDLSGRWAFVEFLGGNPPPPPADPGTPIIPLVFDITLESVLVVDPPIAGVPAPTPPGNVEFSVRDLVGNEVARMQCGYTSDLDILDDAELVCDVSNPDINQGDTLYAVKPLSIERLSFQWVGPIIPRFGVGTEIVVRID